MTTWEELAKYDCDYAQLQLSRDAITAAKYDAHRVALRASGVSINDHILEHVLGDCSFVLEKNEFPYDLAPGITHCVFWMRPGAEVNIHDVKKYLSYEYETDDLIVFENRPEAKSVAGVPHYQVFFRV